MLGLPIKTEVNKKIPKSELFRGFEGTPRQRRILFDEISDVSIANEISAKSISIQEGKEIQSIYIINVDLKSYDYSLYTIEFLFNTIKQRIVLVLNYSGLQKILIKHKKIFSTDWESNLTLNIDGLNLDDVWSSFVEQIGAFALKDDSLDYTVDQQIRVEELLNEQTKLRKKINSTKTGHFKADMYMKLLEIADEIAKIQMRNK